MTPARLCPIRAAPLALLLALATAPVPKARAQAAAEPVIAARGLSASIAYDGSHGPLRAKPDQPASSPVLVRVTRPDAAGHQSIEFIGVVPGNFDLRDHLERDDGGTLDQSFSLNVRIVSHLPPGIDTDVVGTQRSTPNLRHPYTPVVLGLAAAWLSVPAIVLVRRALRKRTVVPPPPPPPVPTLADEIRALLAAGRQQLSVAQRGRLELLILQFLQRESGAPTATPLTLAEQAARLASLRTLPRSRDLVLAIEAWLHQHHDARAAAIHADNAAAALDAFQRRSLDPASLAQDAPP